MFVVACRHHYGPGDAEDGRRRAHRTRQGDLCGGPVFHCVGHRTDEPAPGDEKVSTTCVACLCFVCSNLSKHVF